MYFRLIVDRHDPNARGVIRKHFEGADKLWMDRHLDKVMKRKVYEREMNYMLTPNGKLVSKNKISLALYKL